MGYYEISSDLVLYLTRKLHQGTVTSSNNVNNWIGTMWMTPILGACITDAHLGHYWTFVIASALYLLGMCLLTLAVSLSALRPPPRDQIDVTKYEQGSKLQLGMFYSTLYVLAIGTDGTKPNISNTGIDQFDILDPKEKAHKLFFSNWWIFSTFFLTFFASTFLVYIQDEDGWAFGCGLTIGLAIFVLIFLVGTLLYKHRLPAGSPFTRMARVIVATIRKWRVSTPSDPQELFELDLEEYATKGKFRIDSTNTLRFLNKASVRTGSNSPWMLCSVTQVEETKQMLCMIPILFATFVPSTMLAQIGTLFVKQGTTLGTSIGSFHIPPASLCAFVMISMLVCVVLYDRFFVKMMRRWTKNPRGITLLQRMGIGVILHIIIMLIASLFERRRLRVARQHI